MHAAEKKIRALADYAQGLPTPVLDAMLPALDALVEAVERVRTAQTALETGRFEIRMDKLAEAAAKATRALVERVAARVGARR